MTPSQQRTLLYCTTAATERYRAEKDTLLMFFFVPIYYMKRENEKKGKRNCIVYHTRYTESIEDIIHLRNIERIVISLCL